MFGFERTVYDEDFYKKHLKDFLPAKIVDCHTHIYKKDFLPYGTHNGGSKWVDRVAEDMTAEDLVQTYRDLLPGIEVTPIVFGGVLQNLEQTNQYVAECAKRYDFPALFRTDYKMTAEYLQENVNKNGFRGLKPYVSGCPDYIPAKEMRIYDYLPEEHLHVADKNRWIVMLHIPRADRLRDKVNLAQILQIENNYPNLKLIVAHVGRAYTPQDFGNAFEVLSQTKRMMFDFSANVLDSAITEGIKAIGAKRVLFGSDLPIAKMRMYRIVENGDYYNVVPKGLYGDLNNEAHMRETQKESITCMLYEQLSAFKRSAIALNLKDSEIEDIMYGNAERLLRD